MQRKRIRMLDRRSTRLYVSPRPQRSNHSDPAIELFKLASACSREFAANYNDQQDLASDALLAALRYRGDIRFPRQFIRRTIRNLCIDRSRSIGARELIGCESEASLGDLRAESSDQPCDVCEYVALRQTIERMEAMLSPAERRCYELMRRGYEQRDLPAMLGVSRQAVSRMVASIRRKYLVIEDVTGERAV